MSFVTLLTASATVFLQLSLLLALGVYTARKIGFDVSNRYLDSIEELLINWRRELALSIASVATIGSLYFSEILGWEPCLLCWYQRIIIYPMVVLLGVAVLLKKKDVADYIIPLSMVGISISAYHLLLQWIDELESGACSATGPSCEGFHMLYFGYVSVPMMALTAILAIIVLLWKFNPKES